MCSAGGCTVWPAWHPRQEAPGVVPPAAVPPAHCDRLLSQCGTGGKRLVTLSCFTGGAWFSPRSGAATAPNKHSPRTQQPQSGGCTTLWCNVRLRTCFPTAISVIERIGKGRCTRNAAAVSFGDTYQTAKRGTQSKRTIKSMWFPAMPPPRLPWWVGQTRNLDRLDQYSEASGCHGATDLNRLQSLQHSKPFHQYLPLYFVLHGKCRRLPSILLCSCFYSQ